MSKFDFAHILQAYGIEPASCTIREFKRGHINDSFVLELPEDRRYFLQRINHHVFRDPESLILNMVKVNAAMEKHFGNEGNPYPQLLRSRNKTFFYKDPDGNFWRVTTFVPGSRSFNIAENAEVAREGAAAFSRFQMVMNQEFPEEYPPTIPDFHHLGKRLKALEKAIAEDARSRSSLAGKEVTFALGRLEYGRHLEKLLLSKTIPIRVTHNDTKLNNVLFRSDRIEHICVVDLDTVMPGTLLYDYGDMVRTFTSPVEEDEPDPGRVVFRKDIFDALTDGYLSSLRESLTTGEKENLLFGAKVMLLMIGARFLTDFLEGDHYFKTSRENHNLERCRNQFVLLDQLEEMEDELQESILRFANKKS